MSKRVYILFFLLIISTSMFSQRWRLMRYEYIGGAGVSFGQNDIVGVGEYTFENWFGLEEAFALRNFGAVGNLGFRYRVTDKIATKLSIDGGRMRGADKKNHEGGVRKFTTMFIEPSIHLEYALKKEGVTSGKYSIMDYRGGMRSSSSRNKTSIYVFGGLAGLFFKPVNNEAVLSTYKDVRNYFQISLAIPAGIGAKYTLGVKSSVCVEIGGRYTLLPFIMKPGDYVDGFNTSSSTSNDIYGFINVFWATKLRTTKNGWPILKRFD